MRARFEILAPARAFSHPRVASALLGAIRRGVIVHLLLDRALEIVSLSSETPSSWREIRSLLETHSSPASDRVVFIIDRKLLIAGLFSFVLQRGQERLEHLFIATGYANLVDDFARRFVEFQSQCASIGKDEAGNPAQRPAA